LERSKELVGCIVEFNSVAYIPSIMLFPFALPDLVIALTISGEIPTIETT
jgi:hypothetical protein